MSQISHGLYLTEQWFIVYQKFQCNWEVCVLICKLWPPHTGEVTGVFRGLSPLEGALRSRYGAIARWLAHLCYWDKELLFQRVPEVKSTSTTWNGCQGSRRVERHLYTTSYCMPQLLLFLPSLHSLTSMVLRFINSLFMTSAAIKKRKRTGRIQFSCAWPSSLSWFVFCLPSFCFFAFKNLCVATMHEAGVSFTSSLPFYCFYLFLFTPGLGHSGQGQLSRRRHSTRLFRTFQNFSELLYEDIKQHSLPDVTESPLL